MTKTQLIKNPLTLISVFAALAETGGTVVLPMLAVEMQKIFIWYVILFPPLLVLLFFVVLYFRPKNLYAPGDYTSDDGFLMSQGFSKPAGEELKNTVTQTLSGIEAKIDKLIENPQIKSEISQTLADSQAVLNQKIESVQNVVRHQKNLYVRVSEILNYVASKQMVTSEEVANRFGVDDELTEVALSSLVEENKLSSRTEGGTTFFLLSRRSPDSDG